MSEEIQTPRDAYYERMDSAGYREKINTPARNPEYFKRFHKPLVERMKTRFGSPITLLDIACGPADELRFLADDPDVRLIATDASAKILKETRKNLPQSASVLVFDVTQPSPIPDDSVHAGILLNAMVYVPDRMLASMYQSLVPGGECVANFFNYHNEYRREFYEYYEARKGAVRDKQLTVETARGSQTFDTKVLDYRHCVDDSGAPDERIRGLAEQLYFQSLEDIRALIALSGFEVVEAASFDYAGPVSAHIQTDVFMLRKPLS